MRLDYSAGWFTQKTHKLKVFARIDRRAELGVVWLVDVYELKVM